MIRPKMEYAKLLWIGQKKKHVLKLERTQRMATKMVSELKDLTQEEKLIEWQLTTLEKKEKGVTDRKDQMLRRKREIGYLRGHKTKLQK